jgi:hypothetical protein
VSRRLPELVLLAAVARATLACNAFINLPTEEDTTDAATGIHPDATVVPPDATDARPDATDARPDATDAPPDVAIDARDGAPDDALADAADASDAPACALDASDLASNRQNCGACGHDCLGGDCAGGVCQPVTLVVNAAEVQGIAVDDTYVYFTQYNDGILSKVLKAGGSVEQLFRGANVWLPAVAGPNVYATGRTISKILYVQTDGGLPTGVDAGLGADAGYVGNVSVLSTAWPNGAVYGIAANATDVYWTDLNLGNLWRTPVAGPHPSPPIIAAYSPSSTGIALSDAGVVWGGYMANIYYLPFGAPDAEPLQLTRIPDIDLRFVAMDDTRAYFTMSDNGSVWTVPLTGGETTLISREETGPWAIAVDSSGVYWANFSNGPNAGIRRARFENGAWSVTTVVNGTGVAPASDAVTVALDSKAIYWADFGDGTVKKVAK